MNISNNILELIEAGYKQHCAEIKSLVDERLNIPAEELFSRLFKEHRDVVDAYCDKKSIDLAAVLEANDVETKKAIGLYIIEDDIRAKLAKKSRYDTEFKNLGINNMHIRITNGIENSPWLALFNNPVNLQWWSKNTSKVIEKLVCSEKQYNYIVAVVESIKNNWVDPQSTRPDREAYWELMEMEVPEEVKDIVVKSAGN